MRSRREPAREEERERPGAVVRHWAAAALAIFGRIRPEAPGRDARTRGAMFTAMTDLIVWFDGGCPLCRREIALMRRLDRRGAIRFVDAEAWDADCPLDRSVLLARFHALEDGRVVSGAAAFAAMWRAIPVLRPLGLAARAPLALAGLERLYVAFLRARPRLQRWAARLDRPRPAA